MGEGGGREEEEGREEGGEIGVPHSPILLLDHIQTIGQRSLFGNIDANRQNKETMSSYCCMPGLVKCGMSTYYKVKRSCWSIVQIKQQIGFFASSFLFFSVFL